MTSITKTVQKGRHMWRKVRNFIRTGKKAYKYELCTRMILKIGYLVRHRVTHTSSKSRISVTLRYRVVKEGVSEGTS